MDNNSDYNNSINNSGDDINTDDWVVEYSPPYQVKNNAS